MKSTVRVNGAAVGEESKREHEPPPAIIPGPKAPFHAPRRTRDSPVKRPGTGPYDALLWRLQARQASDAARAATLGLVGCERRVGVTTIAANLAVRASELQLGPVLLVETTATGLRFGPARHVSDSPGLAQLLSGQASYADCLCAGPAPDLSILHSGICAAGDGAAPEPGGVEALLAEACADHRLVIFDLPAADQLQHTLLIAKQLDQVLLVVRADATRQRDAQRIADRLLDDGIPLTGAILNRQKSYVPRWLRRRL